MTFFHGQATNVIIPTMYLESQQQLRKWREHWYLGKRSQYHITTKGNVLSRCFSRISPLVGKSHVDRFPGDRTSTDGELFEVCVISMCVLILAAYSSQVPPLIWWKMTLQGFSLFLESLSSFDFHFIFKLKLTFFFLQFRCVNQDASFGVSLRVVLTARCLRITRWMLAPLHPTTLPSWSRPHRCFLVAVANGGVAFWGSFLRSRCLSCFVCSF